MRRADPGLASVLAAAYERNCATTERANLQPAPVVAPRPRRGPRALMLASMAATLLAGVGGLEVDE